MPRRYNYTRRRTSRRRDPDYKHRRTAMKPSVQITIVLIAVLVIFVILQSSSK